MIDWHHKFYRVSRMLLFPGPVLAYVVLVHITGNVFGDCVTAPSIAGAFRNGSITGPYSEGVVLRYLCSQAYDRILGGSNYYKCSSGVWTGGDLKCRLGSCIAIDPPSNSYIVVTGYYVGETTTFRCHEGYEMTGDGSIMCMADRSWSPKPPTCVKVRCPEFSTPDADIFQDSSGLRNEFGSKNKITCKGGTFLQGPQYISCLANKTWSGSPRCITPNCGNPSGSSHPCTKVYYTDGNTNIGSQVEVICLDNAIPFGANPFLICSVTGTWSHDYRCLCGCIRNCDDSVNTGPRNVTHNTVIDCPCRDGGDFQRICSDGILKNVSSCRVTHSTSTLPVTHPSTTLPVTQPTTTLPVTHPTTTLPVTQPTTTLPVTQPTTTLPVTHPTTTLPVTQPTTTLPVTQPTTTLPVTHPTTTLPVTHPTMPPSYPQTVLITIVVSCVVVFIIITIAATLFCCLSCKNRRAQLRIRYNVCCQDKISNTCITPEKNGTTLIPLYYQ